MTAGHGGVPRVGTTLGRYALTAVLGRGAMATVFRGRDQRLGRDVAIKVMNLAIAARSESAERFRREALAVAAIKHPGIVEIFEFVPATEDEPSYIVSELIAGPTLREFVEQRRGRLLPEVAALLGAQVAEALAVAHEAGIVHRDVKPDNVMLERSGSTGRVVLTDFGLAHVTGLATMTATGALMGSPAYMSPEQARGGDAGPAADLWALGVWLYEATTGHVPFPGREPLAVLVAITRGAFKRPSQLSATVGPAFEALILRCLHQVPGARYLTAAALARDLRACATEAGVTDERAVLRRCLEDPDALEADLRPVVAAHAVDSARRFAQRAQFAKALAEIGRATAYVPDHAGATAVLKALSARKRWMTVVATVASAALLAGGAWATRAYLARPVNLPAAPVAKPVVMIPPAPAPEVPAPQVKMDAPQPTKNPVRAKRLAKNDIAPPPLPATEPPAPPVAVAPPDAAAQPVAAGPPGRIVLRSSGALCFPTIDGETPTTTSRVFEAVPPGVHKVFCPRDKNGPRLPVGDISLRAGGKVDRAIVIGADGKPTFRPL